MELTDSQQQILRHMLGIDVTDKVRPEEYRDYFCANPGDPDLHELQRIGMVRMYAEQGGYEWFETTDAGKTAARASQRARLEPKPKRMYSRYLEACDYCSGLTFREFLTLPDFAEIRRSA